tara:strand:- start:447 stop:1403 length:957 start_codon:yes stop_codon:yes gene_type:complete
MGFFKPTAFFTGAVKEGISIFDEAEQIGKEGLETLKKAKDEVQEEIKTVSDNYDKAIAIADNAGGGAFGKYLFNYYGNINNLAGLQDLAPSEREEQLSILKNNFSNLPDEEKARLTDGDFSEMVQSNYDKEVEQIKVNKGLVNSNNMGEATANTLVGKVQNMVDKRFQPQRDSILSSVTGRDLRESVPVEGGFDAIPSGTTGVVDWNTAGPDYFSQKDTVNKAFEKYFESRRFKTVNTFTDNKFMSELGNVVGLEDVSTVKEKLTDAVGDLRGQGYTITEDALAMDILKQNFINQNYGDFFNYNGFLNILEDMTDVSS